MDDGLTAVVFGVSTYGTSTFGVTLLPGPPDSQPGQVRTRPGTLEPGALDSIRATRGGFGTPLVTGSQPGAALTRPGILEPGVIETPATAFAGVAAVTLRGIAVGADGAETFSGAAVLALRGVSVAATGFVAAVTVNGNAAVTLPGLQVNAIAQSVVPVSDYYSQPGSVLTRPGALEPGALINNATAAITLPNLSIAATGAETFVGAASVTLRGLAISAAGSIATGGSADITLPGLSIDATGLVEAPVAPPPTPIVYSELVILVGTARGEPSLQPLSVRGSASPEPTVLVGAAFGSSLVDDGAFDSGTFDSGTFDG